MQHCYQLQAMSKKKYNFQQQTQHNFNHLCFLVKRYFPTEQRRIWNQSKRRGGAIVSIWSFSLVLNSGVIDISFKTYIVLKKVKYTVENREWVLKSKFEDFIDVQKSLFWIQAAINEARFWGLIPTNKT